MVLRRLAIDWDWVRREIFRTERIPLLEKNGLKHIIHIYVDRALEEAVRLAKPKGVAVSMKVRGIGRSCITIEGGVKFSGAKLSSYLKKSESLEIFLVTLGSSIEKKASHWMSEGEPLYGYLLDRIGSMAVESAAGAAEKTIRRRYSKKGKSVSMRFSPGYCDWPVEEQVILDKVLGFSKIGVRLTGSSMMVPKKSISAAVGVAGCGVFKKTHSPCTICGMRICDYRR